MSLPRGRVIRAQAAGRDGEELKAAALAGARVHAGRVVKAVVADATVQAASKLAVAEAKARALVSEAEHAVLALRRHALEEARQAGAAELVAAWIRFRAEQAASEEQNLDRTVELARALAERLLGESLRLLPETIIALARQVLLSARQARRLILVAHPADADVIRNEIAALGLEQAATEIHADPARPRGSLLVETDLGTLDANLTIQLDRLARALRDSLRA